MPRNEPIKMTSYQETRHQATLGVTAVHLLPHGLVINDRRHFLVDLGDETISDRLSGIEVGKRQIVLHIVESEDQKTLDWIRSKSGTKDNPVWVNVSVACLRFDRTVWKSDTYMGQISDWSYKLSYLWPPASLESQAFQYSVVLARP